MQWRVSVRGPSLGSVGPGVRAWGPSLGPEPGVRAWGLGRKSGVPTRGLLGHLPGEPGYGKITEEFYGRIHAHSRIIHAYSRIIHAQFGFSNFEQNYAKSCQNLRKLRKIT